MIDKISKKILSFLSNNETSEEQKEILLFGITRIVEDIPKTVGIIIIGFLLGILKEMLVVTIIIITYKTFTGGVHAKTNFGCFIYSIAFYLIIIYMAKYIVFNEINRYGIYCLIYMFSVYTIFVYVPADVPEIPKVNMQLRATLKLKSFLMLNIIYVVTLLCIKDLFVQRIVIYSVLYIGVMTTRSVYRLFNTEYGLETYIPDELI